MANNVFDTTIIRPLERPLSSDLDAAQSQIYRTIRELQQALYSSATLGTPGAVPWYGFLGDSFKLYNPSTPGLDLRINSGIGFFNSNLSPGNAPLANIGGVVGLDDLSSYQPIVLPVPIDFSVVPPTTAGVARRDRLQIRLNRQETDTTLRWLLNTTPPQAFTPMNIAKTLAFTSGASVITIAAGDPSVGAPIEYKLGAEAAYAAQDDFLSITPAAADPGYVTVAIVNVVNNVVTLGPGDIGDFRSVLFVQGGASVVGRVSLGNKGNTASVDYPNTRWTLGLTDFRVVPNAVGVRDTYDLFLSGGNVPNQVGAAHLAGRSLSIPNPLPSTGGGIPYQLYPGATPTVETVDAAIRSAFSGNIAVGQSVLKVPFGAGYDDYVSGTAFPPVVNFNMGTNVRDFNLDLSLMF